MSDQQDPTIPIRTWAWIVFSCLTTLLPANSMIIRPEPVTTALQRTLLVLVLNVKTLLFPQLVLFEAVTQYGTARIIRDRFNAAAELCHKASLPSNDESGPTAISPPQTMWDKIKSWIFGKRISLRLVCETGDGCTRRVDFTKFTMAHGHFALMGGFTVGVPLTANDEPSLDESQDSPEVVSLRLEQLFALVEKKDHRKARFDLFAQISENQIKQLHEYSYIQHLVTMVRLLSFVWHCYQRQRLGLETSPLEVLTVGHVFMAILIEIFWWNKPPYLRLPIQNLDRQALCQAIPGLEQELDGRSAARGKKTVDAYTSSPTFRVLQWLPSQDKVVGLKSHSNFPAAIVSFLCACNSAIIWFPDWRLKFPTVEETLIWDNIVFFMLILGAPFIPASIALHIADRADPEVQNELSERDFEKMVLQVGLTCLMLTTTLVVLAAINFRRASEGIYAVGPGDISKFNVTIF